MDFTQLRNDVEHLAAVVRANAPAAAEQEVRAQAVQIFGQVAIGIFEDLQGIRRALEKLTEPQ